jgi:hypothetical protein
MSRRRDLRATLAVLALAALLPVAAQAQPKAVKPSAEFKGAVADVALLKEIPAGHFIANEKDLEKLWTAWKIGDKMPKVDFTKDIVVIATTRGSTLRLTARLDDKGNLRVGGFGTRDFRPGFRYVIAVIPREGVKSINGKELPKS